MQHPEKISEKILSRDEAVKQVQRWRLLNKTIAFTNGCFDILHRGHIFSLSEAAKEADKLLVAVNSDASTRRLKGPDRPINDEQSRALLLAHLQMVDAVVIFDEDTPRELIALLLPDVLVKGGDYTADQIAGAKEVIDNGGRLVINPIVEVFSSTAILDKITRL
jgi:D-beta-D-heptose 7-phosphate kinase/D-beta-D-heptose 1-phosphate adenosyltransferase